MKTVVLKKKLIFILKDTALLILNIIVSTKNFTVEELIKKTHKFIYKNLLENENYLELDSIKNLLLKYILILTGRKNKKKELPSVFLSLIVLEGSKDSILPILSFYNINNSN